MQHIFTTVLIAIGSINFISAASIQYSRKNKGYTVCESPACKNTASFLQQSINKSIDPCDDFYGFACGGWKKNHPIPSGGMRISQLALLGQQAQKRIRDILEDKPKRGGTEALNYARKIYKMCMDTDTLRKEGFKALQNILLELGGWPIATEQWNLYNDITWHQVRERIDRWHMSNGLFVTAITVDPKHADKYVAIIAEPNLYLPRNALIGLKKNFVKRIIYQKYMEWIATNFAHFTGQKVLDVTIKEDAKAVVDFEIELATILSTDEDARNIDKAYNKLTIKELQNTCDKVSKSVKINWLELIRNIFSDTEVYIPPTEKLLVPALSYLVKLISVLEKTSPRTIVNYMMWQTIRQLLQYVGGDAEKVSFEIEAKLNNVEPPVNHRWKTCVQRSNLDNAISYEYIQRHTLQVHRDLTLDIINNIKNVIENEISKSSWMDEETKKVTIEKLAYMKSRLITPEWYSAEAIDLYYDGISVTSNYLETILNLQDFEIRRRLAQLRKPVDRNDWGIQTTTANAFYMPTTNAIVLTAAIIQDPIFNVKRPEVFNYGSIGSIVGHEMSHGFDNNGRKFDKNGYMLQWWTNDTINAYNGITKCFIDQYNDYVIEELLPFKKTIHVNGRLTLGENIGDSAGVSAAFKAYKAHMKNHDIRLPGLEEYSSDQMFFVSFANTFCENITPSGAEFLNFDVHPRPRTRIRGSLSNMKEYSQAFNCPAEAKMNPRHKCTLWQ